MEHAENPGEFFNASQAAEYLRKKWGLESWDVNAFRQYRHRLRKKAKLPESSMPMLPNSSVWTQAELDALPVPENVKRRDQKKALDTPDHMMLSYA